MTFRMTFRNPLLRLLVGPVDATYGIADRSLKRYEGISNLQTADGKSLDVQIDFPLMTELSPDSGPTPIVVPGVRGDEGRTILQCLEQLGDLEDRTGSPGAGSIG